MMEALKLPEQLQMNDGDLAKKWEQFLEQFKWYLCAVNLPENEDEQDNVNRVSPCC